MSEYQLQIKQIVDYSRCRIYRQFVQSLIKDRSIRVSGGSGLFHFTVLCSYANFRTSYRRIDGFNYTIYPGEWICTLKELNEWLRTKHQYEALNILATLQSKHLIEYIILAKGKVVKYKTRQWDIHNTVLDYNCPCQKDTGFFFFPIGVAAELLSSERCSEMDIVLDLWLYIIYNDVQVEGSALGPVVYIRNGTGNPLVSYSELAERWGISKTSVCRILKKLEGKNYLSLMSFQGRTGTVIYLQNYLSTMFQISEVMIDKEEVAMALNIKITLPEEGMPGEESITAEHEVTVPGELSCVPKTHIEIILGKMEKVLDSQGISCFRCSKSKYMLFPLSTDCLGDSLVPLYKSKDVTFGVRILCGNGKPVRTFEVTLSPIETTGTGRNRRFRTIEISSMFRILICSSSKSGCLRAFVSTSFSFTNIKREISVFQSNSTTSRLLVR